MSTTASGRVWKFGDNINGDEQILDFEAVRDHSKVFDPTELKEFCFVNLRPEFRAEVEQGDIVVGGKNFAKPAHDQVVVAIQACGVSAIICESCEERFIRKGYNIGIPILALPCVTDLVDDGHKLTVDLVGGRLTNEVTKATLEFAPIPERMIDILSAGGVVPYLAQHLKEGERAGQAR